MLASLAASRAIVPARSVHIILRNAGIEHHSLIHNLAHMRGIQVRRCIYVASITVDLVDAASINLLPAAGAHG